jgi:putative ABC transport system substrate-binding protein
MRRREFIALLVGAAAQWSRATRADVLPIIGFVSSRSSADSRYAVAAFRKGLTESGYTEGQNVKIEFRWAEGKYDRLSALVNDLIAQKINVLVAVGGDPTRQLAWRVHLRQIPVRTRTSVQLQSKTT